jgi:hypothetical protein
LRCRSTLSTSEQNRTSHTGISATDPDGDPHCRRIGWHLRQKPSTESIRRARAILNSPAIAGQAALDRLARACGAVREKEQALKDVANSPEFTLDALLNQLK